MVIHESRLTNGTLKLGPSATAFDASCQVTNCRITSTYSDDGDSVTVLCGDTKPPPRKLDGHKLEGTFVQDFDADAVAPATGGIIKFCWDNNLQIVAYEYVPNDVTHCPTITGNVQIEIPGDTYGGDVGKRVTSDFAWNMQETPTFTAT